MAEDLRDTVRTAISNAYYGARNHGQTMEQAADDAADAVMAVHATDDITFLRARAEQLHKKADKAARTPAGRPHAAVLRQQAAHCGFAAGELRDHHAALAAATDKGDLT